MCQIKDIGAVKVKQIKARLDVEKRIPSKPKGVKIKLKSSQAFVEKFFPFLRNLKKEILKIMLLDPKLQLIIDLAISKGSLNANIVHPRKLMTSKTRKPATSFGLIPNHPSGEPTTAKKTSKLLIDSTKSEKLSGFIL
jgi:DNA repair protein RadC